MSISTVDEILEQLGTDQEPEFEVPPLDPTQQDFVDRLVARILIFMDELVGHELFPYQRPLSARIVESLVINDGEEITALFARQCLDGDTVVFRRDGTACRLREHEDAWSTGIKPTKRYCMRGGAEFIATDNHPVMTDRGWIPAGLLCPGDKISTLSQWPQWSHAPVSAERAHLLGYFTTDGTGLQRGQSPKFTNTREEYLSEFTALIEKTFDIVPKVYPKGSGADLLVTTKGPNLFTAWLRSLSWDHGFPTDVFAWAPERAAAFVNRAWSGDGCITMKAHGPEVFLACGNDEVYARYWQMLLWKFGITSTVKRERMTKGKGTFHRLVVGCGARNLRRFFTVVGLIYGKETQSQAALDYFDMKAQRPSGKGRAERQCRRVHSDGLDGEQLTYATLLSIEDAGEREVFDVIYEGKGWFIAQGAQVHNSGKTETLADTIAACAILLPRLAPLFPDYLSKFKDGLWIGVFGPVESQAENLFGRVVSRLTSERALDIMLDPEIDESPVGGGKFLRLKKSGSFIRMQTANPRAKIEGRTYHLIVIDEAQDADEWTVRKCYAEGTRVWLPDGVVAPMEDVVRQRLDVLTYDTPWDVRSATTGRPKVPVSCSVGTIVGATPSEWHDNGIQPVWRVTLGSGKFVEVTENHRWYIRSRTGNRQIREALTRDLKVGDTVPVPKGVDSWGEWGTEADGYFFGAMLGDGCMTGGSPMWCGMADGSMEAMRAYAEKHGCDTKVTSVQPSGLLEVRFTQPVQGRNNANPLTAMLRDHNVWGKKGTDKALAHLEYSREFCSGFLAGLIDTDGSIGRKVEITTISETLMRQVLALLTRFGIYASLTRRTQTGGFGDGENDLWTVSVKGVESVRHLAKVVDLRIETKQARLLRLAAQERSSRRSSDDPRRGYNKALMFDRIVSIEYAGEKRTYCVTVEPSHTVIVDGFVCTQSIHPMGTFTNATIVKTGTPTTTKGDFYKAIQRNKRRMTKRRAAQNHFEADWKQCARNNPNYAKAIKREIEALGEDSDEFQMSYALQWLLERGMFTTSATLDELGDKTMQVVKAWWKTPIVIGIDPARKTDSTVVTAVYVDWDAPDEFGYFDHRVLNWLELHGDEWEEQYFRIVDWCENYNILAVAVDAQGVGDAIASRLARLMPRAEVVPIPSTSPEQSKRWKHLMELMGRHRVGWPAHAKTRRLKVYQRFYQQMEDLEKHYQGPHLLAKAPEEADAHDDYPDSLALACVLTKDLTMPEVQVSYSPFFERRR